MDSLAAGPGEARTQGCDFNRLYHPLYVQSRPGPPCLTSWRAFNVPEPEASARGMRRLTQAQAAFSEELRPAKGIFA